MTQRDYIAIAKIIRERRPIAPRHTNASCDVAHDVLDSITSDLADYFHSDNPRFKRSTFYDATYER